MAPLHILGVTGLLVVAVPGQSRPSWPDVRLQLQEILDRRHPPATVEVDGRIFEIPKLAARAQALAGVRPAAALVDVIVIQLLADRLRGMGHYPSDATFKAWWRLRRSFENSIAKEITDKS